MYMCIHNMQEREQGFRVIWNKLGLCQRGGGMKEKEMMRHALLNFYTILIYRSRQVDSILWWKVFLRTSLSLPP